MAERRCFGECMRCGAILYDGDGHVMGSARTKRRRRISMQTDSALTFTTDPHAYQLNGVTIPSVTQIMRFASREVYGDIDRAVLDAAADRGTRVHAQTEAYDLYGFAETDDDTAGYFAGYMKFIADYLPVWTGIEWMGYHKALRYAGRIDRFGFVMPDDGTGVDELDIKTTSQMHPILLKIQHGGYAEIAKSSGIKIRRRYGLQLMADGNYRLQEVPDGFKVFLYCLGLHNELTKESK